MSESDNAKKHIQELTPDKSHEQGCVTKHVKEYKADRCAYRYQGYQANRDGGAKQARYEMDFTLPENAARLPMGPISELKKGFKNLPINDRTPDDPRTNKDAWKFVGENYKIAYLPFNHNYHHIMPFEALKQLSYDNLKLLQAATYNLNSKENLIILPCLGKHAYALMLPAHPYNHSTYNKNIKKEVNGLLQEITGKKENHELTSETAGNLKTRLVNWEVAEYEELVKLGASEAANKRIPNINKTPIASI